MENSELARITSDIASIGNIHPLIVADDLSQLISGGDDKVRMEIKNAIHSGLIEIRDSIPWYIPNNPFLKNRGKPENII